MSEQPITTESIPRGTRVLGAEGRLLGTVREAYPHYLLVDQADAHDDLTIPAQAIVRFESGELHVSITHESASEVDHEETAHHLLFDDAEPS